MEETDRFTTIDMQTEYRPKRILKRSGYYAGMLLASQRVEKHRYEDLKSALKPFIRYDMENGKMAKS